MDTIEIKPFFKDGIRFECINCGLCCTGAPGEVRVTEHDVEKIAAFLELEPAVFRKKYVRRVDGGLSLKERRNGDCVFFSNGCTIYPVRPVQCRTYPFWFRNVRTEREWKQTVKDCPGIGQGRLYSQQEILENVHADMEEEDQR